MSANTVPYGDQNCGNCVFYVGNRGLAERVNLGMSTGHLLTSGQCRQRPPRHKEPLWPEVDTTLWCGEWKHQPNGEGQD
jgi:hypothetical protein